MVAILIGLIIFYGLQYHLNRKPLCFKWDKKYIPTLLIACGVIGFAIWIGAGQRSVEWIGTSDRSVTNRFAVWQGGLEMFGDNPLGVGLGNSGYIYSKFYQVPDALTQSRTMVNSFLTFLNEFGVIWSGLILGCVVLSILSLVAITGLSKGEKS